MKLLIFIISLWTLQGCVDNTAQITGNSVQSSSQGTIVCGELDNGERDTFPSVSEMNANGAAYLHNGPCYGQ